MHRTTALLFWERCDPNVRRLRHQSFVTATVRERSQRIDDLVLLRTLLWDRSVPTCNRATPYHFLRLPLSQKWRCSCVKGMLDAMNETNAGPTPLWLNGQIFTLFYRLSVQRWEVH